MANVMAFKMLKEGQLVPHSASSASPRDTHLGSSPTKSHQTRNDGPRRRHVCVPQMCHMTHPEPLAHVGPCENFPKTAKLNLILPLSFLIAPLPFHAAPGNAQCKPWPAPPTRNLMYNMKNSTQDISHVVCSRAQQGNAHLCPFKI